MEEVKTELGKISSMILSNVDQPSHLEEVDNTNMKGTKVGKISSMVSPHVNHHTNELSHQDEIGSTNMKGKNSEPQLVKIIPVKDLEEAIRPKLVKIIPLKDLEAQAQCPR